MNVLQVPKVIGVRCDTVVSQIINRIQAGPAQAGLHHCSAKSDLLNFVTHNWKKRKRRKTRNPKAGAGEEPGTWGFM